MQGRLEGIRFDIKKLGQDGDEGRYKISIKVPMKLGWIDGMNFIAGGDGFCQTVQLKYTKKDDEMVYFEAEAKLRTQAIYHYHFSFELNGKTVNFKKGDDDHLDRITDDEKWQMPVNFEVPEWAKDKIMYHVFVDRFYRGSKTPLKEMPNRKIHKSWDEPPVVGADKDGLWNADYYGGDLKGVEEKLEYIKSLGASIIYLSPIVTSQSNHRYDAGDYEQVDPYAGCNKDLKSLCDKAHRLGMKVILDAVFNHTGNDSKYFNELDTYPEKGALQSKSSKYFPFYRVNSWKDEGYVPKYDLMDKLPKLHWNNKKWEDYIYDGKGIVDLWYHFDKDHKTEPQEATISEGVKEWCTKFLSEDLGLDEEAVIFENNQFWYLFNGEYVPIANRMMYVLCSLKDKIKKLGIKNIKDVINLVTLDALLTFYKTKNGDKLSLVFDEFKKAYPKNTIYHIVDYIRGVDITKVVKTMSDEEIVDKGKPYRKYLNNDREIFSYWWTFGNLPECNGYSKEWQDYIYGENGVIDKWFKLGIDGLRLDVADDLSDEFLEGIRRAVKRNKEDGFILGEVWKNPMRMNRPYISSGKAMDSVMNYVLVDALIKYYKYGEVGGLAEIFRQLRTEYPKETMHSLMNFTSTHDISRAVNLFGTYDFDARELAWKLPQNVEKDWDWQKNYHLSEVQYLYGKKMYESYLFTLAFMPGNISIFYGDEIGMQGMGNLANRAPFNWNGGDQEILAFVRKIGEIRSKEKFLTQADLHLRDINDRYVQFERETPNEQALVTVSRFHEPTKLYIPGDFKEAESLYKIGESNREELSPYGGLVLKKYKK